MGAVIRNAFRLRIFHSKPMLFRPTWLFYKKEAMTSKKLYYSEIQVTLVLIHYFICLNAVRAVLIRKRVNRRSPLQNVFKCHIKINIKNLTVQQHGDAVLPNEKSVKG